MFASTQTIKQTMHQRQSVSNQC